MTEYYDRCKSITFDDGICKIEFQFVDEVDDYDDYIIVESHVLIDNIDRGWRGDIAFNMVGTDLASKNYDEKIHCHTILKDVLCSARTFKSTYDMGVTWYYKFLKY